jgi:hypothetical protein
MSVPFAGCRRNEGLGRSSLHVDRSSSLVDGCTGNIGCPLESQGGERAVSSRRQSTSTRRERHDLPLLFEGRVLHLVQRHVPANRHSTSVGIPIEGAAFEDVSRSGKPVKTGRTGTGAFADGWSTARHVSPLPQGRRRDTRKRKEVEASVPARIPRARVWLPACRKLQLQNSVGDVWSQIRSANALSKRAVRVE